MSRLVKTLLIVGVVIVLVLGIGFGGYYIYLNHIYDYENELSENVSEFFKDGEYEDINEIKEIMRLYSGSDKMDSIRNITYKRIEKEIEKIEDKEYTNEEDLNKDTDKLKERIEELYEDCIINNKGSVYLVKESKYEDFMEDIDDIISDKGYEMDSSFSNDNYYGSGYGNYYGSGYYNNGNGYQSDGSNVYSNKILNVSYREFDSMLKSGKKFLIIVVYDGCSYCTKFKPEAGYALYKMNLVGYQIDTSVLTAEQYNFIFSEYAIQGTPTTLIFDNGKLKTKKVGYLPADEFETWLRINY